MRILLLTHSFNSLAQRMYVELAAAGHEVSVELDVNDAVSEEAVALARPELVIAPFLKRAIPASIWRRVPCWIVHPGVRGDRGPSSLDWAILEGVSEWGVTILQANAEMDAGDVWAEARFPMRRATKSSLYRFEVTEAAVDAVFEALDNMARPGFRPSPAEAAGAIGRPRPYMTQTVRRIDWVRDDTDTVLRKIRCSDGAPGVADEVAGRPVYLYNAHAERARGGRPGEVIGRRDGAILRATRDGAVWIGHVKEAGPRPALKLPAAHVLRDVLAGVPEIEPAGDAAPAWREIVYREEGAVGFLEFDFLNGAMSTERCERLRVAYERAKNRPTRVIVLLGGADFWSNGMDLNAIEASAAPAEESWRNINAIDDLAREILLTERQLTIAAMRGNAGAGGVFLALAADEVYAAGGVVLNPHYKNMGNLYGSEYWTYTLPRRVKRGDPRAVMNHRLPISACEAMAVGLVDAVIEGDGADFLEEVRLRARALAADGSFNARIDAKRARRARDEAEKPLARYREEELAQMRRNFYGFDPSYHVARSYFVRHTPPSWTPRHLAIHRAGRALRGVPAVDAPV